MTLVTIHGIRRHGSVSDWIGSPRCQSLSTNGSKKWNGTDMYNFYIFAGIGKQFSQSLRLALLLKEHAVGKLLKNEITFG